MVEERCSLMHQFPYTSPVTFKAHVVGTAGIACLLKAITYTRICSLLWIPLAEMLLLEVFADIMICII